MIENAIIGRLIWYYILIGLSQAVLAFWWARKQVSNVAKKQLVVVSTLCVLAWPYILIMSICKQVK